MEIRRPRLLLALSCLALFGAVAPSARGQAYFSSHRFLVNPEPFATQRAQASVRSEQAMLVPVAPRPAGRPEVVSSGSQPTVQGYRAVLRRGIAYAPSEAPLAVKRLIWAANTLRGKPYKWGGGHGSFRDTGYDCSGTISFALHHAGALTSPLSSRGFSSWGRRGRGRWITVYSRDGHVFAMVAGLRLDATGINGREGPRWHQDSRSTRGFQPRSAPGL